ncbi:MAG: restriction endonuclease subunit S [Candidatus Schekmanbacteria bacterium]|nr:restriction endonuclease subunit S [Candidatus Schekmanbacteria bacterium]
MAVSEWRPSRLGDLVEIKHGWPFKSEHFHEDLRGRPIVLSVGNFRYTGGFRLAETSVKEYRDGYPKEYELAPSDILLIMTCQTAGGEILGIPARVPDDGRVYLHNQRLGKVLIRDGADVDSGFLYWLFLWQDFNRELVTSASGTKILHTAPSRIGAFRFELPPKGEQRAIAHILGTLDDKIDLNRRVNETLEAMARALFRSWFVDFDPVRAKAEGRDPGLPKPLADLFPDSFEDSALGEIPKEWCVGRFGDVVEQLRDQENPLSSPEALFHHFSLPAFDEGQSPKAEYGESIKSQKSRVPTGVVLLSKLNPEIERVWLVDVRPSERAVCSTEFLVLRARSPFTRSFVYCLARSPLFRQQIEGLVTGTSKSHQRAQVESILNLAVVVPTSSIVAAFDRSADGLLVRSLACRRESRTLAALRDALLPKLISGELRVNDAERFISEGMA